MGGAIAIPHLHYDDTAAEIHETPRPKPLLVPALALMAGIWLSEVLGPGRGWCRDVALGLPLIAFALLLVSAQRQTRWYVPIALVAIIALAIGFTRHQSVTGRPPQHIVHALADEPMLTRLTGLIVTEPIERPPMKLNPFLVFDPAPRAQLVLAVEELHTTDPPTPIVGNVRVSIEAAGLNLRLGDHVQVTGKLYRPRGPRNPGELNWVDWYRQQGIDAGMSVDGAAYVERLPRPPSAWYRLVATVRSTAQSLLFEPFADMPADASVRLLDVMVLGQRSVADRQLNDAFLRAGGLHFLAVSGFNVAVLATAAWWVVRRVCGGSARLAALLTVALTLLFTLVTEPNAPILRGALGVTLAAVARAVGRPMCAVNWLALAAGCILIWNPNELFRAGFQLTFVQVLVLITVVPCVYRAVFARDSDDRQPAEAGTLPQLAARAAWRAVAGLTLVCVCTWASALPLVLLHFGRVAPWGWLGTIPLTPLVTVITVLSLITLAANAVVPPLGALLGVGLRWLTDGLLWTVGLFERVPGAVVDCQPPPAWLVLLTYGVLFALVAQNQFRAGETDRPGPRGQRQIVHPAMLWKSSLVALPALAWIGWLVLPAHARGAGCALHVLEVGNGAAALLTTSTGQAAVFDVGTDTNSDAGGTVARALRALRVPRVDMVLISHANVDHYSGLPTLMRSTPIGNWLVSPYFPFQPGSHAGVERLLAMLPPRTQEPGTLSAGARLTLGEAMLEVLWPPDTLDESWAANDRSLVIRISAAGTRVLVTGDIEKGGLRALLDAERAGMVDLRADVLIAPHHGSVLKERNITADFYAAVSPAIVVVSSRTPRPKLEQLVREVLGPGGRMILTGKAGDVIVRIGPTSELLVETPYAQSR